MKNKFEWINFGIVVLIVLTNIWQFIVVPVLPSVYAWTLFPLLFINNTLWSSIHEALHGSLFQNRALNLWSGRILTGLFGSSFQFLNATHFTHHAVNRVVEQLEVIKPGESRLAAKLRYYFFHCGGLYFSEVVVPIAFISPLVAFRQSLPKGSFTRMVVDRASRKHLTIFFESLFALCFLGLSLHLYGHRWYLFFLIVFARAFFVSSLDYIYHYGNVTNDVTAGYNLRLPIFLSKLILNFNFHHTHHLTPTIPWYNLPTVAEKRGEGFDKGYFEAAAKAWNGPA